MNIRNGNNHIICLSKFHKWDYSLYYGWEGRMWSISYAIH